MLNNVQPASLFKRLAAMGYDAFLLVAILFIATAILLPITGGNAITRDNDYFFVYIFYLIFVVFMFFGWFWTHGGQTLGMKTWKIKLISAGSEKFTWNQALVRFVAAIFSLIFFGAGFFWSLFNTKRATWHDIASNSIVIDLD